MGNLKLITTEKFGDLDCNFYRNMNDDILLTREQIGSALEYTNPQKAIDNIHSKHKDRLDKLSITLKTRGVTGQEYPTTFYTQRGIMEICRWSRQKRANEFMDWVWTIVEKYRSNALQPQIDLQPLIDTLSSINNRLSKLEESTNNKKLPINKYSRWKSNVFTKIKLIQSYVNEHSNQNLSLSQTMKIIFDELQDTYDIDLSEYTEIYKCEYGIDFDTKVQTLDVINHYKDIREMFTLTLDSILEKLHIEKYNNEYCNRNIFDELASKSELSRK